MVDTEINEADVKTEVSEPVEQDAQKETNGGDEKTTGTLENISLTDVLGKEFESVPKEVKDALTAKISKFISDKTSKELLHIPKELRQKEKIQELMETKKKYEDLVKKTEQSIDRSDDDNFIEKQQEIVEQVEDKIEDIEAEIKAAFPELVDSEIGIKYQVKQEKRIRGLIEKSIAPLMNEFQKMKADQEAKDDAKAVMQMPDFNELREDILNEMAEANYSITFTQAYQKIKRYQNKFAPKNEVETPVKTVSNEVKKRANMEQSPKSAKVTTEYKYKSIEDEKEAVRRNARELGLIT